jgi:hypothetical protein
MRDEKSAEHLDLLKVEGAVTHEDHEEAMKLLVRIVSMSNHV